jgi:hypothetical protein
LEEKRAETVVLVIVQAALPAAQNTGRRGVHGSFPRCFQGRSFAMVNDTDSNSAANVLKTRR